MKSLEERMKEYEYVTRIHLTRRMPLIIRLDGKAFHTLTRGFKKPFDGNLVDVMKQTTIDLCKNIEGCVFGYFQSDEISLLLVDYQNLETCSWFDKNLQKIISVASSMCTLYFNKYFNQLNGDPYEKRKNTALFDARCFVIPKEEVVNYFL